MNLEVSLSTLFKQAFKEYGNDKVSRLGAALAYYTFSSFFPLLLVLIALIGVALSLGIPAAENAREFVLDAVSRNLPAAGPLLEQSFQETEQNSGAAGLFGILTGLWAASNIFAQLEEAFNVIFDVPEKDTSFIDKLKDRAQAAGIVVLIAVLLIGSLVFSTFVKSADALVQGWPGGSVLAIVLTIAVSLILTAGIFAALFKYIPDRPVTWKAALIGGAFTSVTWQIGRELLTWYLGSRSVPSAGEVVGAVLAFLALVYYGSQILMFGGELTATYDQLTNPDEVTPPAIDDGATQAVARGSSGQTSKYTQGSTHAIVRTSAGQHSVRTFGIGFATGLATTLLTLRMLLARLVGRLRR